MNAIETDKLTKMYGASRGINELELSVETGDFFGFIGPNGAGKSTTIRTLLGLISPTSGSAKVLGYDIVSQKNEILSRAGYLPSEINFTSGMKVSEVIKYSADLRHKKCKEQADLLCDRLSIDVNKKVDDLSLGNRKKVGIVCAVQHEPELLILDEPTSGLDPLMQREFFEILKEQNEKGSTIFFSSHILSEVQNHCRTAAFIRDGRIIVSDKVEKLEETGAKKVTLTGDFDAEGISGINDLKVENDVTSFLYKGDVKLLLKKLADSDLSNVNITEPSLEEIFMNYYEG
ncbi:MAG: ABC transporter ATP-binding protein [Lachnospiraceae bacterium]|jgi:ABC-2 type transport system ATP-binding protein|nr:ABC transporter ATP-binding protein [Lachnospiraceae bacterium]